MMKFNQQLNGLQSLYIITLITFSSICSFFAMTSLIDAWFIRINDYYRIGAVISLYIQTSDMISDCFFVAQMNTQSKMDNRFDYFLIFYLSILFIVVPAFTALFQLFFYARKHWMEQNNVRRYIQNYATVLLASSIVCGSAFATIPLLNSYLFKLPVFNMGLTDRELKKFGTKRVYSIVLLENLPQICLQAYFLWTAESENNGIAVSSMILSFVSIIVSIMAVALEKSISFTQGYVVITMHIKGNCVLQKTSQCRTLYCKLQRGLAQSLEVDENALEFVKP